MDNTTNENWLLDFFDRVEYAEYKRASEKSLGHPLLNFLDKAEYEANKKLLEKNMKGAVPAYQEEVYFICKIGEALRENKTHLFIEAPDYSLSEPIFLSHAEDTNLIIEVLEQRRKEFLYTERVYNIASLLNEVRLLSKVRLFNELEMNKTNPTARQAVIDGAKKVLEVLQERSAEWTTIVTNLQNAIKKDTNTEMSEEEDVYHTRRIYNISVVLAYMLPGQFRPKEGKIESDNAKAAYCEAHDAYTKKHGKNPVWNGEALKPLSELMSDPEKKMWELHMSERRVG